MKVADIRRTFLEFFRERDHRIVPPAPLIPNDPTLLLTNAGMNQFKPYFLGQKTPEFKRAASCQKCARTTDIENVGLTARHHSLFEMLGNFSFGDYYKAEIAKWSWELVTEKFGLEPDRLWITIYETDDEAFEAWHDGVGIPAEKIVRRGAEDNFWSMGVAGPCGPCSEIFYDRGPQYGDVEGFQDGDRIMEFWNLVFMELEQDAQGNIVGPLPARNVDTGMGLERTASILQRVDSNYDIDVFRPILAKAEELTGRIYGKDPKTDVSLRILADHARFASFLIADGVIPANEDRGYVLRRVIRRAVRRAKMLGVEQPVMPSLAEVVTAEMGDFYTELVTNRALVERVLVEEEERFRSTLDRGITMLTEEISKAKKTVPGDVAFKLHDTYGFPLELTVEIASEHGLEVDRPTFEQLMGSQRERARGARKAAVAGAEEAYKSILAERGPTDFLGYSGLSADTPLVGIVRGTERVPAAGEGDEVEIVLARTPFYPEGGGQVGDTGTITIDGAVAEIADTQKVLGDLIVHRGRISSGEIRAGVEASAVVDAARRAAVTRSHTATHILHATLREVLGEHARQAGSLVEAGRLRFDFPHSTAVPRELLDRAEEAVNARVVADATVRPYETTQSYARSVGALALFGEKYGDIVRVVEVGDYSIELCGGTHVEHTAQIGGVKVLGEGSIGANLRRVEALTGAEAISGWRHDRAVLGHIAMLLNTTPAEAPGRIERLLADLERAEAAIAASRKTAERGVAAELAAKATRIGDAALVIAEPPGLGIDDLRRIAVETRDAVGGPAVVILASALEGKPGIASAVTKDLVSRGISAKGLIASAAKAIGGGGGGKDDIATGGGPNPEGVAEALRLAEKTARAALGG
jgi:alanyl-tRNA synthetase